MALPTFGERVLLAAEAKRIWFKSTRRGRIRPSKEEREVLLAAYHESVIPKDKDYGDLGQWVEDGFPEIGC